MKIILSILGLFLALDLISQDTLVLCMKNDENKTIRIPFEKYEVTVITKGHGRCRALLIDLKDSALIIKPLTKDPDRKTNEVRENRRFRKIIKSNNWSEVQIDSIKKVWNLAIKDIYYHMEKIIPIRNIKKLKISNKFRIEKRRLLRSVSAVCLITCGVILVSPLLIAIFNVPPALYLISYGLLIAEMPFAIASTKTRLNLKYDWKIKGKIKN